LGVAWSSKALTRFLLVVLGVITNYPRASGLPLAQLRLLKAGYPHQLSRLSFHFEYNIFCLARGSHPRLSFFFLDTIHFTMKYQSLLSGAAVLGSAAGTTHLHKNIDKMEINY
jgi:hypothetical protein